MQNSFDKYVYQLLLTAAIFALTVGTVFYHLVERLSWLDSYYFSVITLTTVGYGDIAPHTPAAKIFTTFYVMFGIGIITTFISYTMKRRAAMFEKRHDKTKSRK